MKYTLVATGGTFDKLHRGHRDFLEYVLSLGDKVVLGLTSDAYIKAHKNDQEVAPFEKRKADLEAYLDSIQAKDRVEIVSIDDQYGPSISGDYLLDAIVVTEDTKSGGEQVNKKREEIGLLPLPIEVFMLTKTSDGVPISSSRIRKEILLLPPTLRILLQAPIGDITYDVPNDIDSAKTITVGDVTTKNFLEAGIQPFLCVIDNKIERRDVKFDTEFDADTRIIRLENQPGTINKEAFKVLEKMFGQTVHNAIIVDGEEDLLVLPVIIHAPLGFTVFYGQPHAGMIQVLVTEEVKKRTQDLLGQFDTSDPF